METKYPGVTVTVDNGNVFAVMAAVAEGLRRQAGLSRAEAQAEVMPATECESYGEALAYLGGLVFIA